MGGAWTALASGMSSAFWNPAPSIQTPSVIVGGAYEERSGGLFALSSAGGTASAAGWGVGALAVQSDLYDVYILAGGFTWDDLSAGIGVNAYVFGVPGQRATGLGFDAGCRHRIQTERSVWSLAISSKDIGWTKVMWRAGDVEEIDYAAWVSRAALAISCAVGEMSWAAEIDAEVAFNRPPLRGEADYWEKAATLGVCGGIEWTWGPLRGRLGLQSMELMPGPLRIRPTFGIGFAYSNVTFGVAMIPSALGSTYLGEFHVCF